tara:strand:+ start:2898 stop:3956 length:1059 start_codon:yes stop_codon:yes gene_type:complete
MMFKLGQGEGTEKWVEKHYIHNLFLILSIISFGCIQKIPAQGMNLSGLERTWNKSLDLTSQVKSINEQITFLYEKDYKIYRLPLDIDFLLSTDKQVLKKKMNILIKLTKKKKVNLVFAYFNHDLTQDNYKQRAKEIAANWLQLLNLIKGNKDNLYIDLANEPVIYPREWEEAASVIIGTIRDTYPDIKIIYGASNFNSMYELSRSRPLPYDNIIYAFHFYEPYIFTHQGTSWTGNQTATVNIPFPYPGSAPEKMPPLNKKAMGTQAEINYRDYPSTGTCQAMDDKIALIHHWAQENNVEVWCTEYGVTINADRESRIHYLKCVEQALNRYNIKGFVWEYEGNFEVKDILFQD